MAATPNEIYLELTINPQKTDYESRYCQVRDVLGHKCKRRADMRFANVSKKTLRFRDCPICNFHQRDLRRFEEAEDIKTPRISRASDVQS